MVHSSYTTNKILQVFYIIQITNEFLIKAMSYIMVPERIPWLLASNATNGGEQTTAIRANLNRDTKIKKMLPIFCISHIREICCFQQHFFVAPKCVSVCIAADTALSNTNFINIIYVMLLMIETDMLASISCKFLAGNFLITTIVKRYWSDWKYSISQPFYISLVMMMNKWSLQNQRISIAW